MEFFQGRRERYREAGEEEVTEEEVGSCSSSQQKTESSSSTDAAAAAAEVAMVEKEHMFDKVVTPSDVGKLNRLVIPKQHAERYFPLDASVNEKGRLLCFEDRTGKPWRFRYSYWNSSQSYVMTKGWSRFVKEKKLDAGDIVSFGRATSAKDRLFIDWKRRPETLTNHLHHHHHHSPLMIPSSPTVPWSHYYNYNLGVGNVGPYLYMRSAQQPMMQAGQAAERPVVFESIPVVHEKVAAETTGKRMRLFGVNFDCAASTAPVEDDVQLRLFSGSAVAAEGEEGERKGKASSSFDLDV